VIPVLSRLNVTRRLVAILGIAAFGACSGPPLLSQPAPVPQHSPANRFGGVLTWHDDLARTGQNRDEIVLTPANVRPGSFGKRFARPVDGMIYAQPLYVPRVRVAGIGSVDVVIVATEHDSVYAFDASGRRARPLWRMSFIDPKRGITTVPCTNRRQPECDPTILVPEHGITGTPVVDPSTDTAFVYAKTLERGEYFWRLHALDIRTGAERPNSPVAIQASAPGYPGVRFDPERGFGRSGLALRRSTLYVAFASNDDARGWLLGYDASTLVQRFALCIAPTGNLGGIWMGGAAPAIDNDGNLYVTTGNGSFNANRGGPNYGMSLLRVTPHLSVTDYFAPFNEHVASKRDLDFASTGVMLLPETGGPHSHEAVSADKQGWIFVVDRDRLGGFHRHRNDVVEQLDGNLGGGQMYGGPAYFNGAVYYAPPGAPLRRYAVHDGLLTKEPVSQSPDVFNYPGSTPAISSNGDAAGVVWTLAVSGRVRGGPSAKLRAYDARDVAIELYDSGRAGPRDQAAPGTKFSVPTVAGGMVYFGTQTELEAYGLLH
jgi:outer membrane protein assembly factor BamB